ncbi:MAG: hypothetical protein R3234_08395 [Thermoanaerobaculia bacterium]|nr:hypothetical protein [Thermoanaerobaculia bacterium]
MRPLRSDGLGTVPVLVNLAVIAALAEGPGTVPGLAFASALVLGFAGSFPLETDG